MSRGADGKISKWGSGAKIFRPRASFRAIFSDARHRMVELLQNAKEEKTMLWDGTHDLDDLIFPEEWIISER